MVFLKLLMCSWGIVPRPTPGGEYYSWYFNNYSLKNNIVHPTESRKNCSPQCSQNTLKRLWSNKPNKHQLCNIHNENLLLIVFHSQEKLSCIYREQIYIGELKLINPQQTIFGSACVRENQTAIPCLHS